MKKCIVLIWKIACGKDLVWEYFAKKYSTEKLGISSSIRIIAREKWLEETRENLIAIGKEVAKEYGDGYLAEVLIRNAKSDFLIITWPRQLWQLEYLRKNTHSVFIAIESDIDIRYIRMLSRWKIGEDITFEKFTELEEMEESSVQRVSDCMKLADICLQNNGTLEELYKKLEGLDATLSLSWILSLYQKRKGLQ